MDKGLRFEFEKFYKVLLLFGNMKWVVISAVIAVFMCSFALAATCSNDQLIMKLYSSTNAHGAIWNDSNYAIKVCYDKFFTPSYDGSDPHECNSDDVMMRLNSLGNSHAAEDSNANAYPIDICFKGLENCEVKPIGTSCDSGDAEILYLTGRSNAHISTSVIISSNNKYIYKVCCGCSPSGCKKLPSSISEAGLCSELDESSCSTGGGTIAQSDPGCRASNKADCRCAWANGKCGVEWGITLSGRPLGCAYKCIIESTDRTECSGNSKVVSLTARLVPTTSSPLCILPAGTQDPNCKSGSAVISCDGGTDAQLPFFGAWQFGVSLLSIVLIYALFGRK